MHELATTAQVPSLLDTLPAWLSLTARPQASNATSDAQVRVKARARKHCFAMPCTVVRMKRPGKSCNAKMARADDSKKAQCSRPENASRPPGTEKGKKRK